MDYNEQFYQRLAEYITGIRMRSAMPPSGAQKARMLIFGI